jgi:hypothetical protein
MVSVLGSKSGSRYAWSSMLACGVGEDGCMSVRGCEQYHSLQMEVAEVYQ